jgi:gamma-glutamylcyclotransferase (GGCT)/AIG2-like uncharacterized protein YtfP
MQGLAPERVVYAGSASKILAPGLRLGWLVTPPPLTEPIVALKQAADMGSGALDQLAFADVLERGELDHHLRRMRPVYRRRRDALLDALGRHLPALEPIGASAGLHVLAWLPEGTDEATVIAAAEAAGIGLAGVLGRRVAPGPPGLVFGYGSIAEAAIEPGIRRLAAVMADLGGAATAKPAPEAEPAAPHPGFAPGNGLETSGAGVAPAARPEFAADPGLVLAVYGTLRRGERNASFLDGARLLGTGTIAGRLFDMPRTADRPYGYPSLVEGTDPVVVEVYALPDPAMLVAVDELEGYDPAAEAASEYVRRAIDVSNGPVRRAWAYRYTGPRAAQGPRIADGDWVAHRARSGEAS